jgi:putative transposase
LIISKVERKILIEPGNEKIPIIRQCDLLDISRASYYYEPKVISQTTIDLMNRVDQIYTDKPYYGYLRITRQLKREGTVVNHKRVANLMQILSIQAIYPKKNTSKPNPENLKYPYLLRELKVVRPNQVWGTDITYVRANGIWFYLVAILDWYSRYVISWKLSKNMHVDFCNQVLMEALKKAIPEIHNSDQGSQFTSKEYTDILKQKNVQISMDGRGRCFDNIFTERLWRTVKYEEVYLQDYSSFREAEQSLSKYFHTYNTDRLHQSLNYQTPAEVYFEKIKN